jgi:membrane protease subunit HflK
VIRAQGDAERFEKVLDEYQKAKTVTRDRLYLESMERVLPGMEKFIVNQQGKGDVLPLLPLRNFAAGSTARDPAAVSSVNKTGEQ